MNKLEYPRVGEQLYHNVLDNGLNVFVCPKPEHAKSYAFFATKYGGMDMRFCLDGQWHDTPAGVAHFLEHKMFDTQDGNALQDLASNGASPNAFTGNDMTGYYFECTEKFEENLRILLRFVSVPWFTPESVDKEQGIIGQEIRMVEDNPDWQVFMNLMRGMYVHHPIRTSVAGTVESIAQITDQTLYDCHRAFYTPENMVLCVAGNVDAARVCKIASEILPSRGAGAVTRCYGEEEPTCVAQERVEVNMEVAAPNFLFACKGDPVPEGPEVLRAQLLGDLTAQALVGTSSSLYASLYQQGLINSGFDCGCEICAGSAFLYAGGESRDPDAVAKQIYDEAMRLVREGIDRDLWQRLKKAAYGNRVRNLNSLENICVGQAQSFFSGSQLLAFPEVFDAIDCVDAQNLLARWMQPKSTTLSVIWPKEEKK